MIGKGSVWWLTYAIIAGGPSCISKTALKCTSVGKEGNIMLHKPELWKVRIGDLNFTDGNQC